MSLATIRLPTRRHSLAEVLDAPLAETLARIYPDLTPSTTLWITRMILALPSLRQDKWRGCIGHSVHIEVEKARSWKYRSCSVLYWDRKSSFLEHIQLATILQNMSSELAGPLRILQCGISPIVA